MTQSTLRAIVTRPGQEADAWAAQIKRNGIEAVALPMIEIVAVPDRSQLAQAWKDLGAYDALMFVSSNAASHFFAARPTEIASPWVSGNKAPRAWVTGPGSRAALLAQGVPAKHIDMPAPTAQSLDSEALWLQVEAQIGAGTRILIVRGDKASEAADAPAPGSPSASGPFCPEPLPFKPVGTTSASSTGRLASMAPISGPTVWSRSTLSATAGPSARCMAGPCSPSSSMSPRTATRRPGWAFNTASAASTEGPEAL